MPPTLQQATANPHLFQRLLDTHAHVWVSFLWGHCSLLLGDGTHRFCLCPPRAEVERFYEVEWFYEDLQDLLELTPKKDVLFIIGDWNAKVGSQETPGVTGKFGLGEQNEAGQRLKEFCQENTLVTANSPLPTAQEKTLHMDITRWSIPKSN